MSIFLDEEENKKEVEETIKQSKVEGKYMSLTLGNQEKEMKACLLEFNSLCEEYMPIILSWNHRDLAENSKNPMITINSWKRFLIDTRVQAWFKEEMQLMIRTKQISLLDKVGDNNSTATVQALTALLKASSEDENNIESNKIFVYSFIPLTKEEARLNNAQVLNSIPNEIGSALQHISADDEY